MDLTTYVESLNLDHSTVASAGGAASVQSDEDGLLVDPANLRAAVNAGSILAFVDGLTAEEVEDVLYSVQFAIRSADATANRFRDTRRWYEALGDVLQNLGWVTEQFAFSQYDQDQGKLNMDAAALKVIGAIATSSGLAVLTQALDALKGLADDSRQIELFDFHTAEEASGNFQVGAVQKADNGVLSMAFGSFHFKSVDRRRKFLFFSWGDQEVNFWTSAQKMAFNRNYYTKIRNIVTDRLAGDAKESLATIKLA
jgi:hypothetical protein